ncbi:uncharacterized protein L201_002953 [Kwoniella dendrophila CBS 6074]|uniref:Phosphatidylinositol glycan, class Q n=1 Tax=Kwoniella dendrophila CBS 6074 TaxID=1295534 RepID=A0AAX4JU32_9TREE
MKVLWPETGISKDEGRVVGWRWDDILCVVDILNSNSQDHEAKLVLNHPMSAQKSKRLEYLGYAQPVHAISKNDLPSNDHDLSFWLTKKMKPEACSKSIQLIIYTPPDPSRLRFLRISQPLKGERNDEMAIQDRYTLNTFSTNKADNNLEEIVKMVNLSKTIQRDLSTLPKKPDDLGQRIPIIVRDNQSRLLSRIIYMLLRPLTFCAQTLFTVLNYPTPIGSLSSISSTIQQISLRLSQFLQGPERFTSTREVNIDIETKSERYIRFWNTVWLIFNDVILGYSARQLIIHFSPFLQDTLVSCYDAYCVQTSINVLKWLNDWPVGLKLNTPLSQFFCTGLGLIIQEWGNLVVPSLKNLLPLLLQFFALSSLGGLTVAISLLVDTINILTSHLHLCYILMKHIFNWQLESLSGLWNLFRGKRWNVLRKRTDSYEYDVDQLFLGTLLFTVSAFLFPTVLTYFGLFAIIRVVVIFMQKVLAAGIKALNAFPLFELMLRIKEPSRLPAGIHIKLSPLTKISLEGKEGDRIEIRQVLELKNSPKSIKNILLSSA